MTEVPHVAETTVIDTLTSKGAVPIAFCFVLRKCIYRWRPEYGLFNGFMLDKDLADACREYLQRNGMLFQDPTELADWVRSQNWPNLEECLSQIKCWK